MGRFLPGLGRKQAEVERATSRAAWTFGRPFTPTIRDTEKLVRDTWERITWVFRAVNAIAGNQARLPIRVRRDDPIEGVEIDDHPVRRLLSSGVSPGVVDDRHSFRIALSSQLLLSPRGAFIEKVRSRSGEVVALQLLPPQHTRPIPHPTRFVEAFEVRVSGRSWLLPAEDVVWVKYRHPLDPYRSMTPAEAAGLAVDIDWLAAVYQAQFLRNDARPGGLIVVKGGLQVAEDADELKAYFRSGPGSAGAWRVIEADGLDAKDLSATPRDAQYVEARNLTKTEILAAYGVPESIIGNASERTFANADAERHQFWIETMPMHCDLLAAALDRIDSDPNTFVTFDMTDVDVYQRLAREHAEWLVQLIEAGVMSIDEAREQIGVAPVGSRMTRSLWRGMSLQPVAVVGEPDDRAGTLSLIRPDNSKHEPNGEGTVDRPAMVTVADADPPAGSRPDRSTV